MKKFLIGFIFTGTVLLTGCANAQSLTLEDTVLAQELVEQPVIIINDDSESVPVKTKAKSELDQEELIKYLRDLELNITKYKLTSLNNDNYYCGLNKHSHELLVQKNDEDIKSYILEDEIFNRLSTLTNNVLQDEDTFKTQAVLRNIEEVDTEGLLGEMMYDLAGGDEIFENEQSYYNYGLEKLAEIEEIAAINIENPDNTTNNGVVDNEDVEKTESGKDDIANIDGAYTFKVSKSRYNDYHHDTDGIMVPAAFKNFLKGNGVLDIVPFDISDDVNYYVYVFGSTEVELKEVKKNIQGNLIKITGEIDFHFDRSDKFEEFYVVIPIDKNISLSKGEIKKVSY